MSNKITIVALVALMLLLVSLPANAAISATSVEVRGQVQRADLLYGSSANNTTWTASNFAGFWYDLETGATTESLVIESFKDNRTIEKEKLRYNSNIAPTKFKVNSEKGRLVEYGLDFATGKKSEGKGDQAYDVVGWMAEKYVGINGKNNKLAKLILEQEESDKMTLTVGQTWEMGGGYTLTAQSIDARSTPRLAWFVLSKDGAKLDDKVIEAADSNKNGTQGVYTYYANIGGESNVPILVTYVDSVFSGATSDMVQLKYTWLIDNKVLEIKSGDTYGIFKVDTENTPLSLKSDSSVSLSKDSTVTLAGNMKFKISDSDPAVRFYPMVEYTIGGAASNVTPNGTVKVTPKANVTTNVTAGPTIPRPNVTAPVTTPEKPTTPKPVETTPKEPGFEAVFAIAGLLAVAFLVLRQRK